MRRRHLALIVAIGLTAPANAQPTGLERLPPRQLEVLPPSARVEGAPGKMRITRSECPTRPLAEARRRIVDIAVQEWGFFGFQVVDQTDIFNPEPRGWPRRTPWLGPEESARVADSIAGYWSITPRGDWILERQNAVWKGRDGVAARWQDAWSAAFVSWVMCEGGLSEKGQFRRAIAHYTYVDQAIAARGMADSPAAFVAFDVGDRAVEPGDLLCSARRSAYRSIAERRRHLGRGVRSHCDIVIKVDPGNERIFGIGGNVRGAVSLKLIPAVFGEAQGTGTTAQSVGRGRRAAFAHLKLRADSIDADPLEGSPTIRALRERGEAPGWLRELAPTP